MLNNITKKRKLNKHTKVFFVLTCLKNKPRNVKLVTKALGNNVIVINLEQQYQVETANTLETLTRMRKSVGDVFTVSDLALRANGIGMEEFYKRICEDDKFFSDLVYGKTNFLITTVGELNATTVRCALLMANALPRLVFNEYADYEQIISCCDRNFPNLVYRYVNDDNESYQCNLLNKHSVELEECECDIFDYFYTLQMNVPEYHWNIVLSTAKDIYLEALGEDSYADESGCLLEAIERYFAGTIPLPPHNFESEQKLVDAIKLIAKTNGEIHSLSISLPNHTTGFVTVN